MRLDSEAAYAEAATPHRRRKRADQISAEVDRVEAAACEIVESEIHAQRRQHDAVGETRKTHIERDAEAGPCNQEKRKSLRIAMHEGEPIFPG
jgi:hypothetical protein